LANNAADKFLSGRALPLDTPEHHFVTGQRIKTPFPENIERILFAMGCFWGAERLFWELNGVFSTAVGYSGGVSANPTYEEVCSGLTGHAEAVLVAFDSERIAHERLLKLFWESHDPTQGMRQGADVGTQYRSAIYAFDEETLEMAFNSRGIYQTLLKKAGYGDITTEIALTTEFYYAEDYHQQYLAKNPNGYCGIGGTGVTCSSGAISPN
jgi:peptide-methionine (S)-S-oxide reductase